MPISNQVADLLSQSPGSIVYFVVILLASQAALGLALWKRRRNPDDKLAFRMSWAALGIFLARTFLLALVIIDGDGQAERVLPPLERALDTVSTILLVWALAPHPTQLPRLGNIVTLAALVITGFIYAFLVQDWLTLLEETSTNVSYASSNQAPVWDTLQMVILAIGALLILSKRQFDWDLRLAVFVLLFLANAASLVSGAGFSPESHISIWARAGHFVALPLVAAFMYRHNLFELVPSVDPKRPSARHAAHLLELSQDVVAARDSDALKKQTLRLVIDILAPRYAAVAVQSRRIRYQLDLVGPSHTNSTVPVDGKESNARHWTLDLRSWPAIRSVLESKHPAELNPESVGARQLHDLYEELGVQNCGPLLIEPICVNDTPMGVLLLAAEKSVGAWSADEKLLSQQIARIAANVFELIQMTETRVLSSQVTHLEHEAQNLRKITELEEENAQIRLQLAEAADAIARTQEKLEQEYESSSAFRASLTKSEGKQGELQNEIDQLRRDIAELNEILLDAEENIGIERPESDLSPEWVLQTVTRYSAELDDAQAKIDLLESRLATGVNEKHHLLLSNQVSSLRSPLTSLGVYSELLISEGVGILGSSQMSLLHRIRAEISKISSSINQVVDARLVRKDMSDDWAWHNMGQVIESAKEEVRSDLRAKNLNLTISVDDALPAVLSKNGVLQSLLNRLLQNACNVSVPHSEINVRAATIKSSVSDDSSASTSERFVRLTVSDSGGKRTHELFNQISTNSRTLDISNENDGIETAALHLATAITYVDVLGGRLWIESLLDEGTEITVLLPAIYEPADDGASK